MRSLLFLTILVSSMILSATPQEELREAPLVFSAHRKAGGSAERTGIGEIEISRAMYSSLNPALRNLRLLAPDGRFIAFAVREKWILAPRKTFRRETGKITKITQDQANRTLKIEYTLDDRKRKISRITLHCGEKQFSGKVSLTLFDETGKISFGPKQFPVLSFSDDGVCCFNFPVSEAKKIVFDIRENSDRKIPAFSIDRIHADSVRMLLQPEKKMENISELPLISRTQIPGGQRFVFQSDNVPLSRLLLENTLPLEGSVCTLGILASDGVEKEIFKGTIPRRKTFSTVLGGIRSPKVVLKISSGEKPLPPDLKIRFASLKHVIVFSALSALPELSVVCGGNMKEAVFELETALPLSADIKAEYTLSSGKPNPVYKPGMMKDRLEKGTIAGAIILAFLCIAVTFFRLLKTARETD